MKLEITLQPISTKHLKDLLDWIETNEFYELEVTFNAFSLEKRDRRPNKRSNKNAAPSFLGCHIHEDPKKAKK